MILLQRTPPWAALVALILVLSACAVTIEFDPTVRATISAQDSTSPTPRLENETLAGGSSAFYRVQTSASRDLLYVEAEGSDLRVSLLSSSGGTIGVSTSPTYFAASLGALATSDVSQDGAKFERSAIDVAFLCIGPCVAARPASTTYFVKVDNLAGTERSFDLLAYTFDHNDTFEPNDTASSAVEVSTAGTYQGAIETLGDADWFVYTGANPRELQFDDFAAALGLVLEIDGGPTLNPGDDDAIYPGERFRVRSSVSRAGPPATSGYTFTVGSVVADQVDGTVLAQDNDTTPTPLLSGVSVAAGATRTYQVNLSSLRDLLYVEAEGNDLRVRLTTMAGATLGVSDSAEYFAGTEAGLSEAAPAIQPSAIDVAFVCVGPCVATVPEATSYRVEVQNLAGSSRTFDLLAYTFAFNDTFEPNGSEASAEVVEGAADLIGAIETLGDVDWFTYTGASTQVISFSSYAASLGLVLEIDGTVTLQPGDDDLIFPGESFRVYSDAGRAGPAGTAGYVVEVGSVAF